MGITNPIFEVVSRKPHYDLNYALGYVGFTYSDSHFISRGIAYFTPWARMSQIKASHALLVAKLSDCFNNSHPQIFFRKPVGLNDTVASAWWIQPAR